MQQMLRFILVVVCALVCVGPAAGQATINGSLRGRINDPSGAALSGANITLSNVETGSKLVTNSDGAGQYLFARVSPGRYSLAVERVGFRRAAREGIVITVNEAAVADVAMVVGAVNDTVTVEAGASIVQSQSAEVSQLISERRVRELPLNGKDFNKLVALAPGAFATPSSTAGSPSVNGARTVVNNYAIDGVAANDERVDGLPPGGGFSSLGNAFPNIVSTEAIREYRIITSNADATFGRGSGGQINVVTKSGTNRLHGAAYEFLRNDALDARDFFNYGPFRNQDGSAKTPPFRQNLFGGSVGGPIVKNRHFFFGNYEGFRQRREITSTLTLLNGDFIKLIPGDLGKLYRAVFVDSGVVPATGAPPGTFAPLTPSVRGEANAAGYPAALFNGNTADGEAGTALVSSTIQSDYNQDAFLIRTDHQLTGRLTANFRYNFAQNEALSGLLGDRIREPRRWQTGVAQFVYNLTPSQILEARGGVQRTKNNTLGANPVDQNLQAIGVNADTGIFVSPGATGTRFIRIRGESAFINNQTIPQGSALHTWTRGGLTLRSGAEVRRIIANFRNNADLPTYSFLGFTGRTGLLGEAAGQPQALADSATAFVYGANGGPKTPLRGYRATQQEYFGQADWRIRRDLTLNLGLRYSDFGVYNEVNDAIVNLYAVDDGGKPVADVSSFAFGRTKNNFFPVAEGRPFYQPDRNNFQPRIGAAWDIGGRGATVLRIAYGLYHDRVAILEFSGVSDNPPYAFSTNGIIVPFRLGAPLPLQESIMNGVAIDPKLRNPYTHRANVTVEQKLGRDLSVSVAYVGAWGRGLLRNTTVNATGSVPISRRPDPRFGDQSLLRNASSSNYDSLQIFAQRRFSQGVDFTVAYTYSRLRDDVSAAFLFSGAGPGLVNLGATPASGFQGGGAQFVDRPVKADWGPSNFDIPHNLVISHVIELPFGRGRRLLSNSNRVANAIVGGWSLAGIAQIRSGQPFSVTLGSDVNDDGATDDRPALLGGGSLGGLYAGGLDKTQYLVPRPDAQRLLGAPAPVTDPFNNIGRNALRAPRVRFYDLSLIKRFALTESVALGFELNAFNVFNQANFAAPVASLADSRFGLITSTLSGGQSSVSNPRQLQLGLKLTF